MSKQPEQLLKLGRGMPGLIAYDLKYLVGEQRALRELHALEVWVQTVPGAMVQGPEMDEWAGMRERDV